MTDTASTGVARTQMPRTGASEPLRECGAYGQRLAACFRLTEAPTLVTTTLKAATLAVTRLASRDGVPGRTLPLPAERAYLVTLQLRAVSHAELWLGEELAMQGALPEGSIGIVQLDERPRFQLSGAFDMLLFYIPQIAFDELASQGAPAIGELGCSFAVADPIVRELGRALLPTLEADRHPGDLFFDHLARALHAHLVRRYGHAARTPLSARGGLAAWQERLAKEMLRADLAFEPCMADIAQACRMPVNRFVRAFRKTIGMPPHRWLRGVRVERARDLLFSSTLSLSQIACECGFADQSHLTRVFVDAVGTPPGAWRQARRGSSPASAPVLLATSVRGSAAAAPARAA
jgi:AraC-like DNA-binding protein